ncbi:unnamed protein product, partial [Urochloa humidicola]
PSLSLSLPQRPTALPSHPAAVSPRRRPTAFLPPFHHGSLVRVLLPNPPTIHRGGGREGRRDPDPWPPPRSSTSPSPCNRRHLRGRHDVAKLQELDEMKRRLKEMEEEAAALPRCRPGSPRRCKVNQECTPAKCTAPYC